MKDKTIKVGSFVRFKIKAVTQERFYNAAGEVKEIYGPIAKVRFHRPWCPPHNCMREEPMYIKDLTVFFPRNPLKYQ
jgi:hypothetical protein